MPINANIVVSNYPQRLSGHSFTDPNRHSYDSRQSYHSNSSNGSLDILDEGGFFSNVNVAELYQRGLPVSILYCLPSPLLSLWTYYSSFLSNICKISAQYPLLCQRGQRFNFFC